MPGPIFISHSIWKRLIVLDSVRDGENVSFQGHKGAVLLVLLQSYVASL